MIQIKPLGGPLGAEVRGVDPRAVLSPQDIETINNAFLEHLVLRFRDAPMNKVELRDFSLNFGELRAHVAKDYRDADIPEVVFMTNQDAQGNFDAVGAGRGVGWHSDGTFHEVPPKATVLHALAIPDYGGNTLFANMYLAYESMPEALRRRVEGKLAVHRLRGRKQQTQGIVAADDLKKMKDVIHPVIRRHPETGKKSVFANPHHTLCIAGLTEKEGDELLEELYAWCSRPEFQWEQEWKVADTIMWENRAAWHSGRPDYPQNQPRKFLRTTICDRAGPAQQELVAATTRADEQRQGG